MWISLLYIKTIFRLYEAPKGMLLFQNLLKITPEKPIKLCREDVKLLLQFKEKYGKGVRQRSVRSDTTKYRPGVDFTKCRKSKINRKCYRKCDFQAFDWLKFTLTTDLRLTTFCEIDPWYFVTESI